MRAHQPSLFETAPERPEGLRYRPELIDADEERALVDAIAGLPLKPFEFRGFEGRRRVAFFGWRYDFNGRGLGEAEPIPDFLRPLRQEAAGFLGVEAGELPHVLVTEYAPGAPIGWHRDRPEFGEVVGVSLLSPCTFRLRRRRAAGGWDRYAFTAEPRAAYTLQGPARHAWEHSIPPVTELRYSITFRRLVSRDSG